MHKINLEVGDWSGDGHDKSEDIYIMSSLDVRALEKAYKKGSKKLGVNIQTDCCADYEDSDFNASLAVRILEESNSSEFITKDMKKEIGYLYDDIDEDYDEDDTIYMNHWVFPFLWLCVAKIGDPKLKFEYVESSPYIPIGGYGLFY